MAVHAVVDTNVLVSALLTKNPESPTVKILLLIFAKKIKLVVNEVILAEYRDVLDRSKFNFDKKDVDVLLEFLESNSLFVDSKITDIDFNDPDDKVFYEVATSKDVDGAFLITGNIKHFPNDKFVVSPAEFVDIIEK